MLPPAKDTSELRASDVRAFREAPLLEELFDCLRGADVFAILELKVRRAARRVV